MGRFKDAWNVLTGNNKPVTQGRPDQRTINYISKLLTRTNHYDAGYTNRLRDDWAYSYSTPYTDISSDLAKLIARSRKEIDNNGIAQSIVKTIVNNVWGEGPVIQAQVILNNGEPQKVINNKLEYAWKRHSDEMDASGQVNFDLFGKEALETIISSGTSLINRVPAKKGQFLDLSYQMLEPDILDTAKDNQKITQDMNERAKQVLHGISIDENYRPVSYFIRGLKKDISSDYMRHFFMRKRPNQVIGVPWLHASLTDLFDYRQLKEDTITKSRILADIAMWVSPEGGLWPGDEAKNDDGEAEWEPGSIMRTKQKPEVIQADGDLNTALKPLLNRVLLDACGGTGVSYMAVSRDMDGVNFAASRTNLNEDRSYYKILRRWLSVTFCQYMWTNFVYQCVIQGKVDISPEVFIKDPYRYTRASFQFPAWDWVDPRADSDAIVNMRAAKLSNLKEIQGKKGVDWRDHVDQAIDEYVYIKEAAAKKGITFEEAEQLFSVTTGGNNANRDTEPQE